jgi:2-aminobenzoate-CoA ligase
VKKDVNGEASAQHDVMAACACWPQHVLKATQDDVFIGSPPLAFPFGLGGLMPSPMSVGASTVLLEKAGPRELLKAIPAYGATVLFTAPTSYRGMAEKAGARRITPPLGGQPAQERLGGRSPARGDACTVDNNTPGWK